MAINDRVVVGDGMTWQENGNSVMVYHPQVDSNNNVVETPDGGAMVKAVGGVKIGSYGVIQGHPINVHRSCLHNSGEYTPNYGSKDFVKMIPIFLEKYQQVAYLPIDNIRIFGSTL